MVSNCVRTFFQQYDKFFCQRSSRDFSKFDLHFLSSDLFFGWCQVSDDIHSQFSCHMILPGIPLCKIPSFSNSCKLQHQDDKPIYLVAVVSCFAQLADVLCKLSFVSPQQQFCFPQTVLPTLPSSYFLYNQQCTDLCRLICNFHTVNDTRSGYFEIFLENLEVVQFSIFCNFRGCQFDYCNVNFIL